jgi:hypothetical protein
MGLEIAMMDRVLRRATLLKEVQKDGSLIFGLP